MKNLIQKVIILCLLVVTPVLHSQTKISRLDSLKQILPKVKGIQKLQVLSDISEVYFLQNEMQEFVKNQAKLKKEFILHPEGSEEVKEIYYCNQAYYFNGIGDFKNVITSFHKAIDIKSTTRRSLQTKVVAYINLCENLRALQQFQQALEYLEDAEKLVNSNNFSGYTKNLICVYKAKIYKDLTEFARKGQSSDEKVYYRKTLDNYLIVYAALKDLNLKPNAEGIRWIQLYDATAQGLYFCKMKVEANNLFRQTEDFLLQNNFYKFFYETKFTEYGTKIEDPALTEKEYNQLLDDVDGILNKKIPYHDSGVNFELYLRKAEILNKLGKYKEALNYFEMAEGMLGYNEDNLFNSVTYKDMSILYEKTGNINKALLYKEKALKMDEELLDNYSIEGEKKMQALLEIERIRQAKQLEFEKLKSERSRNYAIMLLLGLVLAIVIVVLLVLYNKNLKTRQKLLVSELNYNKEVALKNELDSIYKLKFDIERRKALAESEKDIAKNLHDDLASGLAAMNFFIKDKISFATTDKDKKSFGEIKEEVNSMYEGLRKYIHNLYNNKNQLLSVNEYLYDLMRRNETLNSIKFNIKADFQAMDSKLSIFQQNQLYRIIKETVINSLKYSNSKNVNVTIGIESGRCQFSVEDDGQGFSYDSDQGIGLKNINDRVETLGGEVAVKSNPTIGVSLVGSFSCT